LLTASPDGRPLVHPGAPGRACTVAVPVDVERLRREDPDLAREWRAAVRAALGGALDAGGEILGVDQQRRYLVLLAPTEAS
ncbi:MAG: GNAT family N-acetyltransferase, partial [Mycobacteriales bacterium]